MREESGFTEKFWTRTQSQVGWKSLLKLLEKLEKFSGKVCDEKTGWFELWGNPGTSPLR